MATKTAEKAAEKPAKATEARPAARRAAPSKAKGGKKPAPAAAAKKPAAKKPEAKPAGKADAKAAARKAEAPKKGSAKAAAKPAAAKKAPAKEVARDKAKSAKSPAPAASKAPSRTPAKKEPAKPAPKAAAKPPKDAEAQKAPAPQADAAAQPSAAKKSADKAAKKSEPSAKKKPETPPKKKLLVGQKPRTVKSAAEAAPPLQHLKASSSVNNNVVKASPASQEAKLDFKVNDHVVYPAHGVGRIVGIEKQLIAGVTSELFLIDFEQEKMKLRVPTAKAKAVGMRALSDPALVKKAVELLKGRARIKRTMWSRRAQEYEAKINSGDILAVAEVVRDLYRATDQPEQSYSERQLFEAALDRLAREVAAVNKSTLEAALAEIDASLQQKKAA